MKKLLLLLLLGGTASAASIDFRGVITDVYSGGWGEYGPPETHTGPGSQFWGHVDFDSAFSGIAVHIWFEDDHYDHAFKNWRGYGSYSELEFGSIAGGYSLWAYTAGGPQIFSGSDNAFSFAFGDGVNQFGVNSFFAYGGEPEGYAAYIHADGHIQHWNATVPESGNSIVLALVGLGAVLALNRRAK